MRVGYAGSLEGTAFKLCNDLYYVKHHSISLDIAILLETLRTLVADKQYVEPPSTSLTMLGEGEGRIVSAPEPRQAPLRTRRLSGLRRRACALASSSLSFSSSSSIRNGLAM